MAENRPPLTIDQQTRFLSWTRQNRSFRDYLVLLMFLRTGLRTTELRELCIRDISASGEILDHLSVRAAIGADRQPRTIPLPNDFREQLATFLDWKRQNDEPTDPASFLFASAKSPQITVRHLQRIVRESTVNALGMAYRASDLRRTCEACHKTDTETTFSKIETPRDRVGEVSISGQLLILDDVGPHVACVVQAVEIDNSEAVATTLSDESGRYEFANLQPGQYQVRCYTLSGYIYYQQGDNFTTEAVHATSLPVKSGQTLSGIDFRFAPFKKGIWKTYTEVDGLADNTVLDIHQNPDGYVWFGTGGGGVSRYDGKDFLNFTKKDGLVHNDVQTIHQDEDGLLWFGTGTLWTSGGGVSRFDGQKLVNLTTQDGLAHNTVYSIDHDANGTLWFGTGGGLSHYDGEAFANFTAQDGLENDTVLAIYCSKDSVIWLGTDGGGVYRYDGKEFTRFTTKDGLADNCVRVIHCDSDGILWFGTVRGVSKYDGETFINLTIEDGLVDTRVFADSDRALGSVNAIHSGTDGVMWFGTDGGVSRYDGRGLINFTVQDGLARHSVRAIHRDEDNVMWFGGADGVSCYYDQKEIANFTTQDGMAANKVAAIHTGEDGFMWFGTGHGCVCRYDGQNFVNFTTEDGLASTRAASIYIGNDNVLWVGTEGVGRSGIFRYDGQSFVNFTTEDELPENTVYTMLQEPNGAMWFGTSIGLLRYDGKEFTTFTVKDGLADNYVIAIHQDANGAIWFGTIGGVSRYDGSGFVNLTEKDGLPNNHVNAIYRTKDGMLWFATRGGVSRYDGKTFVNFLKSDGLNSNTITTIYATPDGVLWFGTFNGVSKYDGVAWASLDTRDRLPIGTNNAIFSIGQDDEGFMWFGTSSGAVRYRPSTIPPRVRILAVKTDRVYTDLSALPSITAGDRITVTYNAIDFITIPEKRQYRVRIKEIDKKWRAPTTADSFDIAFDKAGTYTFEVQAIDRDLNYSEPTVVALTVQPDPRIAALQAEVHHLRREAGGKYHFEDIVGRSQAIKAVCALMERAIDSGLNVLISGETGTGKELVAKAIHYNSSRKDHPLLDLNCGGVPKDLVASTLFGYRKGAFTGAIADKVGLFESAEGGTVILDEIGEMPLDVQPNLLRVLEEWKVQRVGEYTSHDVDVRVIAMTNRDLQKEVDAKRFREDLYYRLNEFQIRVPALRERLDDIPLLAEHFLQEACHDMNKELDGFGTDVFEMLQSYPWPGNVRELRNEIRRACALVEEGLPIQTYHFSAEIARGESLMGEALAEGAGLQETMKRFQQRYVEEVLRECNGNRHEAARHLGLHRPNLVRLIRSLGIED